MHYKNSVLTKKLILLKLDLIREILVDLKHLLIRVSGDSMLPTFVDGQIVVIDPILCKTDLQIGDIVLFCDSEYNLALHRLVDLHNNKFILLGDNAEIPDIIDFNNILGKANVGINGEKIESKVDKQYIKEVDDYSIIVKIRSNELISFELNCKGVERCKK